MTEKTHFVLLRGLARESRHWGDFVEKLEREAGSEIRVDAIDLPGTGKFSEMKSPLTISQMAEFARSKFLEIRENARRAGVQPTNQCFLVAVSLGGMVAAKWLERWPNDFKGVILINSSFRGLSPVYKRLKPMALTSLARTIGSPSAFDQELHVLKLVSNRAEIYEATAKEWATLAHERPVSLENFARQLLAASLFTSPLKQLPIPGLVLNSRMDRMVDPSCSRAIAEKWNLPLIEHPTAGHDLPLDDADWTIKQIMTFRNSL